MAQDTYIALFHPFSDTEIYHGLFSISSTYNRVQNLVKSTKTL